jgi:hypothetical protein
MPPSHQVRDLNVTTDMSWPPFMLSTTEGHATSGHTIDVRVRWLRIPPNR